MSRKLKILALASWYPNEQDPQLGIFVKHQLQAIAQLHSVDLFTLRPAINKGKEVVNENGVNHFKNYYVSNQYPVKQLSWYVAWLEIINKIPHNKYDLIHLHVMYPMSIVALKLTKILGIPLITSEHWSGYATQKKLGSWFRKRLLLKTLEQSQRIIVQSNFLKNNLLNKELAGNFEVVPNIVKLGSSNETTITYNKDKINILNVADHIDKTKNLSELLQAFKLAHNKNQNIHLHQVGFGTDNKKLKKIAKQLSLENDITWYGRLPQKEVIKHIKACNFGILSSHIETFSVFTFELLALQKPLVITPCGGPEEFLPENFGIKSESSNRQDLAKAICQLAETYESYNLEEESKIVSLNFSEEAFKNRIQRIYSEVIND